MKFKIVVYRVHVRRTDKVGTEAAFHNIDEYMNAVEEYYNQLELKEHVDKRRIYLATDDPKVISDAKEKYTHYEVLGDPVISKTAAVSSRYTDTSLKGIILDIHMLSMSDYLVCTFSSQVIQTLFVFSKHFMTYIIYRFVELLMKLCKITIQMLPINLNHSMIYIIMGVKVLTTGLLYWNTKVVPRAK